MGLFSGLLGNASKKDKSIYQKYLFPYHKIHSILQQHLPSIHRLSHILHLKEHQGVEINTNSIFDIQIKRLHEYKRQQMNALYVIHKYLDTKAGHGGSRL